MNIVTIRSLRSARCLGMVAATAAGLPGGPSSGLARDVCAGWGEQDYFEAAAIGDIRTCLTAGADPGARDENGTTPLHWAAASGDAAAIGALLDAGADASARDKSGETAFDLIRDDHPLVGTAPYWRLNDARWD